MNLERVNAGVARNLYFHAFDKLYHAFQEFLQALFIARRVYPIAYDKWIHEQVSGWLGLPQLYARLPAILEVRDLESDELCGRARELLELLEVWARPDALAGRSESVSCLRSGSLPRPSSGARRSGRRGWRRSCRGSARTPPRCCRSAARCGCRSRADSR